MNGAAQNKQLLLHERLRFRAPLVLHRTAPRRPVSARPLFCAASLFRVPCSAPRRKRRGEPPPYRTKMMVPPERKTR